MDDGKIITQPTANNITQIPWSTSEVSFCILEFFVICVERTPGYLLLSTDHLRAQLNGTVFLGKESGKSLLQKS